MLVMGAHVDQSDPIAEAKARGAGLSQFFLGDPQGWKGPRVDYARGAAALKAEKLVMLTDVKGIRDANGRHLSTVSRKDVQRMVKRGTISEGMLPKVHACLDALAGGVGKAHIVDGRVPHAILLEIFTHKGIGTEIVS